MAQYLIGLRFTENLQEKIEEFITKYNGFFDPACLTIFSPKQLSGIAGIQQKIQSFCLAQPVFIVTIMLAPLQNGIILTTVPGKLNLFHDKLANYIGANDIPKVFRSSIVLADQSETTDKAAVYWEAKKAFPAPETFSVDHLALYEAARPGQTMKLAGIFEFTGK